MRERIDKRGEIRLQVFLDIGIGTSIIIRAYDQFSLLLPNFLQSIQVLPATPRLGSSTLSNIDLSDSHTGITHGKKRPELPLYLNPASYSMYHVYRTTKSA